MIQTDKINPDEIPDDTIKRAARARRFGVFNDRLLYACVERYLEMRVENAQPKKPKPKPEGGNAL